mmetsp:Transcript_10322/g.21063  ORF Transcript_10322/g.21063 Transcript_10322/m.21063 type:complete len:207 (+) Transcript_10322:542-1162(+)
MASTASSAACSRGSPAAALANSTKEISPSPLTSTVFMKRSTAASLSSPSSRMSAQSSADRSTSSLSRLPDASLSKRSKILLDVARAVSACSSSASKSATSITFAAFSCSRGSTAVALANSTNEISPSPLASTDVMKRSMAAMSSSPSSRMRARSSGDLASSPLSSAPEASESKSWNMLRDAASILNAATSPEEAARSVAAAATFES